MSFPSFTVLVHQAGPVMVRLFKGALLVLVELILHTQVVLHEETPVDDLPCFDLDGSPRAVAHTVSAVAAKLRFVLCRLFIKGGLIVRARDIVFSDGD